VPTVHRLRIGTIDCALLNDGDLPVAPEILFPRERRELWPAVETNADGMVVIAVSCLVVWSNGQVVLVDTGDGMRPRGLRPGGGRLIPALADAGLQPEEITTVVVTHSHPDHVNGSTYLREDRLAPAFPNARHLLSQADWDYFTQQSEPTPEYIEETIVPLRDWGRKTV
jgi:glyoxylase-like metal-dependent hydrolase (beta-lactamase superfamily II)